MVVFYKGDAAKNLTVDLADTTIVNAKGFIPLALAPAARLQGTQLQMQLAPQSVAIYKVE